MIADFCLQLRTPLHVACKFGVSETVIILIKMADDMSDPVISAAMMAYATVPSIFNLAINSMFFRLFEDFTGFEGMEPTVIATILCFQFSGTFRLQPKTLRNWLLSRRPKNLDSAMPTQKLISDELRVMFSGFSGAQMASMVSAVRHSCRIKSPDLFCLISECGVVNSISDDEVLFSFNIASENGNLVPLKVLQQLKISLQKNQGSYAGDRVQYQGCAELVKSILDERAFDQFLNTTNTVLAGPGDGDPKGSGYGTTPLMSAAINGNVDALRYLIEIGGDVQATDWRGRTALDHARAPIEGRSEAIIELLQEAQRKAELKTSLAGL
jgi:hypothetical protein